MIMSNQFALDLCRALELDISRIRSITIRMEANQPVTVDVERLMSGGEAAQLTEMMSSFVLVTKPEKA